MKYLVFSILLGANPLAHGQGDKIFGAVQNNGDIFQKISKSDMYKQAVQSCDGGRGLTQEQLFSPAEVKTQECIQKSLFEAYQANPGEFSAYTGGTSKTGGEQNLSTDNTGNLQTANYGEGHPLAALNDFYTKKLNKALYGTEDPLAGRKAIQLPEHERFYALAESRMSKEVIEQITNYCIDTAHAVHAPDVAIDGLDVNAASRIKQAMSESDIEKTEKTSIGPDKIPAIIYTSNGERVKVPYYVKPKDESLRKKLRKANTKLVRILSKDKTVGFYAFNSCLAYLSNIAYGEKKCVDGKVKYSQDSSDRTVKECEEDADKGINFSSNEYDDYRSEALIVVQNLQRLRNSLVQVKATKESVEKYLGKRSYAPSRAVGGSEDRMLDDELTSMTSKEYADTVKSPASKSIERLKDCKGDECGELGWDNEDDKKNFYAQQAELLGRSALISGMIADPNNVAAFEAELKRQGKSDDEIKKILESGDSAEVRKHYARRIRDERLAIIAAQKKKLDSLLFQKEDPASFARTSIEKVEDLKEGTAQLLHYTNVVSGYFSFKDSDEKNTAQLRRELASGTFENAFEGAPAQDLKELQENLPEDSGNEERSSFLSVEDIEGIIKTED